MRFDLEFVKELGNERIFVAIGSRYPHSFGFIRALVDTGSPRTIISAQDTQKLNLPISNLNKGEPIKGYGMGVVPTKSITNYPISIKSKDNNLKHFKIPVVCIDLTALRSCNKSLQDSAYQAPSIVGMDFLKFLQLKLVVDFKKNEFYLEEN